MSIDSGRSPRHLSPDDHAASTPTPLESSGAQTSTSSTNDDPAHFWAARQLQRNNANASTFKNSANRSRRDTRQDVGYGPTPSETPIDEYYDSDSNSDGDTLIDHERDDRPFNLLTNPIPHRTHVIITASNERSRTQLFTLRPLTGPLLFHNSDSTARDHCANERTFLSWLRLSVYLAIVSVAIVISFHLKSKPTPMERRVALPLGLIFWCLSIASLGSGLSNYIKTVWRYSRRQALVQSGIKTQVIFTVVACAIIAACVLFLTVDAER